MLSGDPACCLAEQMKGFKWERVVKCAKQHMPILFAIISKVIKDVFKKVEQASRAWDDVCDSKAKDTSALSHAENDVSLTAFRTLFAKGIV